MLNAVTLINNKLNKNMVEVFFLRAIIPTNAKTFFFFRTEMFNFAFQVFFHGKRWLRIVLLRCV